MDVDHQLLFRWKDGASSLVHGQPEGWLFGLYHYKDSACLVWPVDLVGLQGIHGCTVVELKKVEKPQLAFVYSFDDIECVEVEWHSWPWQLKKGVDDSVVPPGIRGFVMDFSHKSPLELGAQNVWWSMDASTTGNIAQHLNVDITAGDDAVSKLYTLTASILGDDPDTVHAALQKRIKDLDSKVAFADILLEVDEAAACLVEADQKYLEHEQATLKTRPLEFKEMKKQFKKRDVDEATNKARGGASRKAPTFYVEYPSELPDFNHLPQSRLKTLALPGGLIWKNRTDAGWCGR